MKKYHVGFTAGTFDMFHVGHLNLLKSAKEQCDHLIVGVNKDSLVKTYKNKAPLIEENQRLEIVKSICHVDEVHLMDTLDKSSAWNKFGFNAVFIGSDYKNSGRYQKEEANMNELGVKIVYIPYTVGVSSTLLAKRIIRNEITSEFYQSEIEEAKRG